ncbi:protease [Ignicoccus pacificus DSM 13166]|uniref:Protease HtpX homolog n=1 Tax=Ignicoccus pacificus DSM 13166 TaxID=940294 RepID=A0A977K9Z6_9CREN|nr:protease [Ignicoccus pacificus DSM 13166]
MFLFWGISYFIEPLILAVVLALFVGLAPVLSKTPKGEKQLKLFMALTVIGYAAVLYAGYALLVNYAGYVPSLMAFALIFTAFGLVQYLIAPWLINFMYGARPAEEVAPWLKESVDRLALKAGFRKPPKAMVADVNIPNAFAYGNFLTGKYIAVTRGLLESMPREEVEAVIGHELGHHKHKDIWVILALSLAPMFIYYLGRMLMEWGFWSGAMERDRENSSMGLFFAGIILVAVAMILNFIILQFNRLREYYADLHGARVRGKREMQRALARIHVEMEKLKSNPLLKKELSEFTESPAKMLFIYAFVNTFADPYYDIDVLVEKLKREDGSSFLEIFMSHPPIPKRLRFLDTIEE